MSEKNSQRIGIIGPAGFGGSHFAVELLRRHHTVVGISRNPQSFGVHERYIPRPADVDKLGIAELTERFSDLDVLVSGYGPHTQGADALQYMGYVETVRKLILAVQKSGVKYFVFVGGAGSLHVPGTHECLADHPDFFPAYRRQIAHSNAHVAYMEERLGPVGATLREYRKLLLLQKEGQDTSGDLKRYDERFNSGDKASDYIKAVRAVLMFFEGNTSFPWTFVSPSPLYRPGKRTGLYQTTIDNVPLKGSVQGDNVLDGRLPGISVADLSVAIADEVERKQLVHQHWTAVGDLSDDTVYPSYLRADAV